MSIATVRPSPARRAEREVARRLERIRNPTTKIAGFETRSGRHLAVDLTVQGVQIWTEDVPGRPLIGRVERYPASRTRNSNLNAQAPRVGRDKPAVVWKLEPHELAPLLDWYDK